MSKIELWKHFATRPVSDELRAKFSALSERLLPDKAADGLLEPHEWEPLFASQAASKTDALLLKHIETEHDLFWLVYFTPITAPENLEPGLYWCHRHRHTGARHFYPVKQCPVSPRHALRQLHAMGKVSDEGLLTAVDLGDRSAQRFHGQPLEQLPLTFRINKQPLFESIKADWFARHPVADSAIIRGLPLRESVAVTVRPTRELIERLPDQSAPRLFKDVMAAYLPFNEEILLRNPLSAGRHLFRRPPPGWDEKDMLRWATSVGAKEVEVPAREQELVKPDGPMFTRETWTVAANARALIGATQVRMRGWIDPDGSTCRISFQRGGCISPEASEEDIAYYRSTSNDVAAMRTVEHVSAAVSIVSRYLDEEGAARITIQLRKALWAPDVAGGLGSPTEVLNALQTLCDEWKDLGESHYEGIAGPVTLVVKPVP